MLNTPLLNPLLTAYHRRTPIRAWSLIVSFYGDAVLHRGGSLWLGSLLSVMEACGVEAGVVRTAMSRLAADGLLVRNRVGRNSYYRLSDTGETLFSEAYGRIYHARYPGEDAPWLLVILPDEAERRAELRKMLERTGAGQINGSVMVICAPSDELIKALPDDVTQCETTHIRHAQGLTDKAWDLTPLAESYRQFSTLYRPVLSALEEGYDIGDEEALILRLLLIHDFRRVVLRDPLLPEHMLPERWPGYEAHALVAAIYRRVVTLAEAWLDEHARCEEGALPPEAGRLGSRFSSLRQGI
ncbi:PaaX family transcriptional regulator [Coralliovum pocilloporae]|uniref:PaaX family transcriptional regulator n=1 Tax=Coralliovum pocilloporae TaxID=3066369 RepID=UPI0033072D2D